MRQSARTHRRVPSVKRTEYLLDFLEVVGNGYSRDAAETKLAQRKRLFEIEKTRALGRGRPFAPTIRKASGLVRFCHEMSSHLGLVKAEDGSYSLTSKGELLLQMISKKQETDALILKSLLEVYPTFSEIIMAIDGTAIDEVVLPLTTSKVIFLDGASRYSIAVDLWGFAIVRDLCSQLGVLNWFPDLMDGNRMQRVFTTCTIRSDINESAYERVSFPITFRTPSGSEVGLERNQSSLDKFREILWNEYLKITNYVPRKPVFYSNLRSRVCYAQRVSDMEFDKLARIMMEKDDKYLLIAAGGSLPFSRDSARLLKSLPPQTSRGEYMVYLKMDERRP